MNETNQASSGSGWQRALAPILWGLALGTITPQFQGLGLEILLPLAGTLFLLHGFRALRRQNRYFQAGWLISILCTAQLFCQMIALASPRLQPFGMSVWLSVAGLLANIARLFCLWRGLKQVQQQDDLPGKATGAGGLTAWYLLMCLLALLQYRGMLVWVMLIAFIWLLVQLNRFGKHLDQGDYPFSPAPLNPSGWLLSLLLTGGLTVCIGLLLATSSQYPMEWQPFSQQQEPQVQQVKGQLLALGFPEQMLADLEPQQILDCQGALQVETQNWTYDLNPQSQDLAFTHAAVLLPGEQEHWKVFHHFCWQTDPGFPGTESICLWPASRLEGWMDQNNFQGRLLYETPDNQTMTASFYSQGKETVRSQTMFWDTTSVDWFAAFSLPKQGQNRRGYLCYDILAAQQGWMIDSWVNYTHQQRWQYPVITAQQHQKESGWMRNSSFVTAQTALQFHPTEIDGEYTYRTYSQSSDQQ